MGNLACPERLVKKIMLKAGRYFQPADLSYQRCWRDRLRQIGFSVMSVERLPEHPVWDIRLRGTLAAQTYLLVSKPAKKQIVDNDNLLLEQLRTEVQQIAKQLGAPIKADCLTVERKGTYVRLAFVWPLGQAGILRRTDKKPDPFAFLIRPWLRRIRN